MTTVNDEKENSSNSTTELTEEQKKAQAEQEEADRKAAETMTAEELREQNKRLFERAKSAEEEKRKFKAERDAALANANNNKSTINKSTEGVSAEELRLIARGLSDEEIDQAKIIAKGRGVSLPEALKDPMFVSYQNQKKEEEKKAKAKLGASKGSGQAGDTEVFKQGMSPEEHKALWLKQQGN